MVIQHHESHPAHGKVSTTHTHIVLHLLLDAVTVVMLMSHLHSFPFTSLRLRHETSRMRATTIWPPTSRPSPGRHTYFRLKFVAE